MIAVPDSAIGEAVEEHFAVAPWSDLLGCVVAPCRAWRDLGLPNPLGHLGAAPAEIRQALSWGLWSPLLEETFARLGWPEIDPAEARLLDAGLVGPTLALRLWDDWVAKADPGARHYPAGAARRAWRVDG